MENVIDYMEKNSDIMVDWMFEFFEGKYTREEIQRYTFEYGEGDEKSVRRGVSKLASEFNSIEEKTTDTIRDWYINTDFYVFDLLPYNGGPMFREKAEEILKMISANNIQTVLDFGGGLGVMAIYLRQKTNCKVYYSDLKGGVTYKFAEFLMKKFEITDIPMLGDQEFFESDIRVDCILATDCFEHIPNMEETFEKLAQHSYKIYHDSTFYTDKIFPQHVYTPSYLDFLNMCAIHNYLPSSNNIRLLNRVYLQISQDGNLRINTL